MTKGFGKKELAEFDLIKCPGSKCGSIHFRHAGNVLATRNYERVDKIVEDPEDEVNQQSQSFLVYVCIGCGKPYVKIYDKLYDATEYIDMKRFDAVNTALKEDTKTDPHC